jgi:hypothetical protein
MKHLSILSLAIISLLMASPESIAQTEYGDKSFSQRNLLLSSGLGSASYRDFATSPLFYSGPGANLYLGWQDLNENRELNLGISMITHLTLARVPESDFFSVNAMGVLASLEGNFSYLRNLPSNFGDQYNLKAGGTLLGTQNLRNNPRLDNSSTGVETLANLMLSGKIEKDISRTEEKVKRFFFLQFYQRPVRRMLTFQVDAGVLNFNHRPSYNYVYFGPIDGTNTEVLPYVLDGYSWSMNGWRLRTRLEYIRYNSSGNGRKIAYAWDVLNAPGKHAAFQMAVHRFEYIILINNNR